MLHLGNLSPQPGSRKNRKRVGRGEASGQGKTAGKGHKGAKARSGGGLKIGFEGGQMPLQRRLPKRGFNNIFKEAVAVVNLKDLDRFEEGATIDRKALIDAGLVKKKYAHVKLLGTGEVSKKFNVALSRVSAAARQKIEAAGGTVQE